MSRAGNMADLFAGLIALTSEVMTYRWLAFRAGCRPYPKNVFAHARRRSSREHIGSAGGIHADEVRNRRPRSSLMHRPNGKRKRARRVVLPIEFGGRKIGSIAIGFASRAVANSDLDSREAHRDRARWRRANCSAHRRRASSCCERCAHRITESARVRRRHRTRTLPRRASCASVFVRDDRRRPLQIDQRHAWSCSRRFGVAGRSPSALTAIARRSDVVGRWGGEEFVVALPQTSEAGARVAAERLRKAIADTEMRLCLPAKRST